ncbi:MAG: alcohol dehydrogenase [Pedosphaera sp.]|nr:alcohol dehydrogenase [Pedosphaera sp.]
MALPLKADDWPHWRGPKRNGISVETGWTDQWPSEGPKIAWKAKVGLGFSSFAVANGRAFTLGHASDADTVFCFEADSGKVLWKHSYPSDLGDKYFDGGTTGTPTVDGDHVFTLGRWGDLFCFEAASGKIVWSKNVQKETSAPLPDWGFGGSPLVSGNMLVLNVGEAGLALDKTSGKIVWKSADKKSGYSTPLPMMQGEDMLMLLGSGQSYAAINPKNGQEAWRIRWATEYGVNAADPIVDGNRVFISSGYGKGAGLFKLGSGQPENIWTSKVLRNQMNPSILINGHLYGVDDDESNRPSLKCVEFATGAEKWSQPKFGSGGLTAADGKLIILGEKGELIIAPATPERFQPSARAQILGGKSWTAPVLANGRVYCRNSRGDVAVVDVRRK